jgi:light-regulated signal transduction histidine kinase (bacteriophytochrome)
VTELETFNYSVSHDLRSPIGAIVNFTSILAEDYKEKLDEPGLDILRRVAGCAQNAVAMMDGLLTFSHIGQQSLMLGAVEMKPLVESVWAEVVLAHTGPAPAFSIGALPSVTADATMMRTVWTNLLSNAVKFSDPSREASIEVGCQPAPEGDVFFVRDNGVGFEMKHATRLFNVFEQLHPTPKSKGHGVGLAIVSRIVRRHGGRVWAQAAPGKGATFYFSIPQQAP